MTTTTKTILLSGVAIIALIVGMILFSSPAPEAVSSTGTLSYSETSWDLGDVPMSEGLATKNIELTNTTNAPVTISRLETSCMCTTVQVIHEDGEKSGIKGMVGHGVSPVLSETIAPGEKATLRIVFDPNAHGPNATGPVRRTVTLETNSTQEPQTRLTFTGNVVK